LGCPPPRTGDPVMIDTAVEVLVFGDGRQRIADRIR
jgi:hypothetical protein